MAKDQDAPIKLPLRFGLGHLMDADDEVLCVMRASSKPGSPLVQDVAHFIVTRINDHARLQQERDDAQKALHDAIDDAAQHASRLRQQVEKYEKALEHYADESFWDSFTDGEAMGYADSTIYNFEDEIEGQIPGYYVAQQVLDDKERKDV